MKTCNLSNRRFCDVGDIFLSNRENKYMICTSYYKAKYMSYAFIIKDYDELNEAEKPKISRARVYTRYNLDSAWSRGLIKNLDPALEAKLNLLSLSC